MYQALYRKYRPRCFCDVAGQEHITETLRRQILSDRLSHAYLFVGTRGTGKTTCAKILSRAVNCLEPVEGEPCNKCIFCLGIEDGSILDVLELDAASNNSVDNVRALRDEAIYSPATVKKRVYIIDEVHMLSLSAFNALLKILEEPPEHILFILATTELHKVPATIQSRCQKYSFKRMSPATLAARLVYISSSEGLTLTDDAAARLAALADGSMRDGISLLDQCVSDDIIDLIRVQDTLGLTGNIELSRLVEMVADRDVAGAMSVLDGLYNDGRDMSSLLNEMTSLVRDLLVYKLSPDSNLLINSLLGNDALSRLSKLFSPERLFFCLDLLKNVVSTLSRSGSSKLAVEMCLIKMCVETPESPLSASVNRAPVSAAVTPATTPVTQTAPATPIAPAVPATAADDAVADAAGDAVAESTPLTDSVTVELPLAEADDFWLKTLELLRNEPSVHVLLSDASKVQALLQSHSLSINVTDSFVADMIKSEFSELIKNAAGKVLGHDVIVNIEVCENIDSEETKRDKLNSLSAFDIVNFE